MWRTKLKRITPALVGFVTGNLLVACVWQGWASLFDWPTVSEDGQAVLVVLATIAGVMGGIIGWESTDA